MNERAIMTLIRTLDLYDNVPRLDWPRHEAEEISYSRCALEEILQLVWDHPWTLASETIENFVLTMESYKAMAVTEEQMRIFSVSSETALAILQEIKLLEK